MNTYILCGGLGTRLNLNVPKSLATFKNKTILDDQIEKLFGTNIIDHITLLTGHMSNKIEDHIKHKHYSNVSIINTGTFGTCDALLKANIYDRSIIVYGDIDLDCNIKEFIQSDTNSLMHLCVHKTDHAYDSDILHIKDNKIYKVTTKPHNLSDGYSNSCLFITDNRINKYLTNTYDIGRDVLPIIYDKCSIYITNSRMNDLGTKERLYDIH